LLGNIFQLCGYNHFVQYFKNQENSKISLSKVIKKIQKKFNEEEWNYLKKYHKRSRTNSKKSSTLSHMSAEEEKRSVHSHSETSSIKSGMQSRPPSHRSSLSKKLSKAEKLATKFADKYNIDEGPSG
jgi:hypothetical protein